MKIVPQEKLIWTFALLGITAALLGAYSVVWIVPAVLAMLVFTIVVLLDWSRSLDSLDALSISMPEMLRMTRRRDASIPISLRNTKGYALQVSLGIALPPEVDSEWEIHTNNIPADDNTYRLDWPCHPTQRGNFSMNGVYAGVKSLWGFWELRKHFPQELELRVYPNLLQDRKQLAAIFLNRGNLGIHAQRRVGQGRDFEKLREYIPGDSFEDIHWKATARRGRPITKLYQLERTQEVYVLIDSSRLSGRLVPAPEDGELVTQLERFINAGLILGRVAEKQGDLFGLCSFSDKVNSFVHAGSGQQHFQSCRDALYTLETRDSIAPDYEELFTHIRMRLNRRALLMFLTNLDDPILAEQFTKHVALLTRRHLVYVNMLTPAGVAPLFHRQDVSSVSEVYSELSGHMKWNELRETQKVLQRQGVHLQLTGHAALSTALVSQYVNVKQRQLL